MLERHADLLCRNPSFELGDARCQVFQFRLDPLEIGLFDLRHLPPSLRPRKEKVGYIHYVAEQLVRQVTICFVIEIRRLNS